MLTLPIVLWSDNDVSYVRSFAIMHAYQSGRGVYQRNSIPIVTKSRITFGIFLPLSCFWVELSALIFVCLFLLWNHLRTFKCRGRGSGSTGTAAASKSILAWEGGYLWRVKCPVWYRMSLSWHTRTSPTLPQVQRETNTEVRRAQGWIFFKFADAGGKQLYLFAIFFDFLDFSNFFQLFLAENCKSGITYRCYIQNLKSLHQV